jgi:hypothetical protein
MLRRRALYASRRVSQPGGHHGPSVVIMDGQSVKTTERGLGVARQDNSAPIAAMRKQTTSGDI